MIKLVDERIKPLFDAILQVAEEEEYKVRSYSGRAMYGKRCLGVVGQIDSFKFGMQVALFMAHTKIDDMEFMPEQCHIMVDDLPMTHSRMDNMGLDMVLYFPYIEVIEEQENEDDED